jgi:hypothetical protein
MPIADISGLASPSQLPAIDCACCRHLLDANPCRHRGHLRSVRVGCPLCANSRHRPRTLRRSQKDQHDQEARRDLWLCRSSEECAGYDSESIRGRRPEPTPLIVRSSLAARLWMAVRRDNLLRRCRCRSSEAGRGANRESCAASGWVVRAVRLEATELGEDQWHSRVTCSVD